MKDVRGALITLVCLAPVAARAGVYGHVSAQGQAQTLDATTPGGTNTSTASLLLSENLGIHYAGMPFGSDVALLGAGLEAANVNAFGDLGALVSGRSATVDVSVGLFPRRALPLRLYARGTLTSGGPQSIATLGGRESFAYGANLNLQPGKVLPGLRVDAEELRFTGVGTVTPLGDLRRTLNVALFRSFDKHQATVSARLLQESRTVVGDWLNVGLTGSWCGPSHTTTLFANLIDRSNSATPLPGLSTSMLERNLRLSHLQRWTPRLSTEVAGRLADARFDTGSGAQGGALASVGFQPFEAHDLMLSAGGDVGFASASTSPATGVSAGTNARVGYGREVGPVRPAAFVGASTQYCGACVSIADGWLTSVDVGGGVSSLGFERFDAQVDYRVSLVRAPIGRGGDRTEHHLRGTGNVRLGKRGNLTLLTSYDDGFRDYLDVLAGGVISIHEQAFTVGGGVTVALGPGTGSLDVRHARGAAVLPAVPFSPGPPLTAREVTSVSVVVLEPLRQWLDFQAGGLGTWTVLDGGRPLVTLGANVGLTLRLGRITAQLTWNWLRSDTAGLVTNTHLARLSLTRPFDL